MAFKMRTNPMQRNYGIGGPMKKTGDPKKASKVVETEKPKRMYRMQDVDTNELYRRGDKGDYGKIIKETKDTDTTKYDDGATYTYDYETGKTVKHIKSDMPEKELKTPQNNVKDIVKGKNKKNNAKRVGKALKK